MVSGSGTTSDRKRGGRRRDARAEGPTMMRRVRRCAWARDPLNIRHHDEEWGVACHDDRRLFEMLILEGPKAGLSLLKIGSDPQIDQLVRIAVESKRRS